MTKIMSVDEIKDLIGCEVGLSDWLHIDQERVNQFADATLDYQYIHLDQKRAAKTPFGGTIAHGFLTLSLISHLAGEHTVMPEGVQMGVNYGCNKLRFLAPVKVGSYIRARVVLKDFTEKRPGQFMSTLTITMEIQDEDKPAMICEWVTLLFTE